MNPTARSSPELVNNASGLSDMESINTIHLPVPKQYPPVGLKNWGNTCYANAALQCLLSTALSRALLEPKCFREFQRYAYNGHLLEPQRTKTSNTCKWLTRELTTLCEQYAEDPSSRRQMSTPTSSSAFFSYFTSSTEPPTVLDPGSITRHVTRLSSCLRVGRQEDAHEFLRALVSTLVMDGQNRKLSSLFDGLLESAVTCQTCGHASFTRDRYMDISLEVGHNDSVPVDLTSLFKHFTTTEILSPDNKVWCDICERKRTVTKGLRLATAPTILVCHLKRFAYDLFGRTIRLNKKVRFPLRLELDPYMSRANRSKPPAYELVSVLVHQGKSCSSGHYIAFVKNNNNWYRCSDGDVQKVSQSMVLSQTAYVLVYEVEGVRNHKIKKQDDATVATYETETYNSANRHPCNDDNTCRSDPTTNSTSPVLNFWKQFSSCGIAEHIFDINDCCSIANTANEVVLDENTYPMNTKHNGREYVRSTAPIDGHRFTLTERRRRRTSQIFPCTEAPKCVLADKDDESSIDELNKTARHRNRTLNRPALGKNRTTGDSQSLRRRRSEGRAVSSHGLEEPILPTYSASSPQPMLSHDSSNTTDDSWEQQRRPQRTRTTTTPRANNTTSSKRKLVKSSSSSDLVEMARSETHWKPRARSISSRLRHQYAQDDDNDVDTTNDDLTATMSVDSTCSSSFISAWSPMCIRWSKRPPRPKAKLIHR